MKQTRPSLIKNAVISYLSLRLPWAVAIVGILFLTASLAYFYQQLSDVILYIFSLQLALLCGMILTDLLLYVRRILRLADQIRALEVEGVSTEHIDLAHHLYIEALSDFTLALRAAKEEEAAAKRQQLDYYTVWAHQIKTPIAACTLLLDELPDSTLRRELDTELFKIKQYTDYVLHYLRVETFHQDLIPKAVSLRAVVNELLKKYSIFFIRKQLRLELHISEQFVFFSDEKWLSILIEQLLSNCLKYTPTGQTILIYQLGRQLVIGDTGIGIRPEDRHRVFERSFTGYNGHSASVSSGLGLYLAGVIAKRLHIHIHLSSEPSVGTLYSLTLPKANELLTD